MAEPVSAGRPPELEDPRGLRRRALVRRLRALGLLDWADGVAFLQDAWAHRASNAAFKRAHPDMALPPLSMVYEVHSAARWDHFVARGVVHAQAMSDILIAHGPDRPLRILEWGCGPGRVTRHLAAAMGPRLAHLTGVDVNPGFIAWARKHLPQATFLVCPSDPPINSAPAQFDALYAISILTHLSAARIARWLGECRRLLKPDGIAVLTIHKSSLALARLEGAQRAAYLAGETVVFAQVREGGRAFSTYSPPAHIAAMAQAAGLSMIDHIEDDRSLELGQDIVVLRPNGF